MQSRHCSGDSCSSWVHETIALQQSDSDPTASRDLLRAADDQVYRRLKIKSLLCNAASNLHDGKKCFCYVFEKMPSEVLFAGIVAVHQVPGQVRLSHRNVLTEGLVCRRTYLARIGVRFLII